VYIFLLKKKIIITLAIFIYFFVSQFYTMSLKTIDISGLNDNPLECSEIYGSYHSG
jgi:hypothetical protein